MSASFVTPSPLCHYNFWWCNKAILVCIKHPFLWRFVLSWTRKWVLMINEHFCSSALQYLASSGVNNMTDIILLIDLIYLDSVCIICELVIFRYLINRRRNGFGDDRLLPRSPLIVVSWVNTSQDGRHRAPLIIAWLIKLLGVVGWGLLRHGSTSIEVWGVRTIG